MSQLSYWIQTPLAQALGRTLAHFLWEGALLAAFLLLPSRRRYTQACLILLAMPLAFAVTFAIVQTPPAVTLAAPIHWAAVPDSTTPIAIPAQPFSWTTVRNHLGWLVPVWLVGMVFFYARGIAGWAAVQRLRRRGVCSPPPEWQAHLHQLAQRLRISRPVALLESCLTDTPVLIGYLRPVVLLPLGCLTGLSTAQVECILLHELAHVARHDYLVNLLQSLVEGLLFYHPAVWWVSSVVRSERENCCDDRVVELVGNARAYAATLATLEQRRALAPALAANGGNLMKRIRRLTAESGSTPVSAAPAISAGVVLTMCAAALAAVPARPAKVRQFATAPPVALAVPMAAPVQLPTPYRAWLNEDVVYIVTDSERAAFENFTTDPQREQFIDAFWQRRDPTPGTVENEYRNEHYRRIAYVNEHFAAASMVGWKTDRGRIYIMYGPPDEIDDHAAGGAYRRTPAEGGGETTTYPFQVWRYRYIQNVGANVVMEFVDSTGSGDFHLSADPSEKERQGPEAKNQQLMAFDNANNRVLIWNQIPQQNAAPETSAQLTERERKATREKQLRGMLTTTYRVWLNQDVAYIISDEERSAYLRLLTDDQREQFIANFWLQRGGPFRAEHYRRIEYANEHFTLAIPGWKTDRGRIYITYGPPDQIDDHGKIQDWTYRFIPGVGTNVIVEFEDDGSGDFRMRKDPAAKEEPQQVAIAAKAQETPNIRVEPLTERGFLVTVSVPLANPRDGFHVAGQITTVTRKLVYTFAQDSERGNPTVATKVRMKPGIYHLAVKAKNLASGVTETSERDFTVL